MGPSSMGIDTPRLPISAREAQSAFANPAAFRSGASERYDLSVAFAVVRF
jgi:hypothetical protein